MAENKYDDNNSLITDIVINSKDTLVFIEVKRNANDARLQLKQQVKSIAAEVVGKGGTFLILNCLMVHGRTLFQSYRMFPIYPEATNTVF